MIKNVIYFFPTFSHFFVTADDYQLSNFQASLLTSECCLFMPKDCLLSCRMFDGWAIILEFAKRLI